MKIVIAGGTGQVGALLVSHFMKQQHDVVVLTRSGRSNARVVHWDGATLGAWAAEIDGADVVINLAGRSVSCRYTQKNLKDMMESRTNSTAVVGAAVATAKKPPPVWLQMSTATIYAHRTDAENDELTGIIGGSEAGVPAYWKRSIDIATAWEKTLADAKTPHTRKVALRTAMVMSAPGALSTTDNVFSTLSTLVLVGLGGRAASGTQYVSFVHGDDFCAACDFLIARDDINGAVNVAAPHPLPYADFMSILRKAWDRRFGLPAATWMLKIGAFVMGTDTELLLKSRRVVPGRLTSAGFTFAFPTWASTANDLVARTRRSLV
jgi:uncharacterized protein